MEKKFILSCMSHELIVRYHGIPCRLYSKKRLFGLMLVLIKYFLECLFYKNWYLYEFIRTNIQICISDFPNLRCSILIELMAHDFVAFFHCDSRFNLETCLGNSILADPTLVKAWAYFHVVFALLCLYHHLENVPRLVCWVVSDVNIRVKLP